MLAMYLAGQRLWLAYGLLIDSGPVVAANAVSSSSWRPWRSARWPRRVRARAPRRLRIAIDMDEVMADALAEHLRRYNAAFGDTLTPAELRGRHLEDWVAPARRAAVEAMLDASFFERPRADA